MDPICQDGGCYMFGPDTEERKACELNCRIDVCECGHKHGDHYAKPGWPACSQCSDCREFKAASKPEVAT